jgi:NAD(P)-dependent dehydrogenase (short-subunit alcohol dehydrogenase family)
MDQVHGGPMAGRTVLVTGGTAGIGRATALGLARMGADLAICGRDRGLTERAAGELRATAGGGQVEVFAADLSSQSQVARRLAATSVTAKRSSKASYDQAAAARLWQVSAELVGLPALAEPR